MYRIFTSLISERDTKIEGEGDKSRYNKFELINFDDLNFFFRGGTNPLHTVFNFI